MGAGRFHVVGAPRSFWAAGAEGALENRGTAIQTRDKARGRVNQGQSPFGGQGGANGGFTGFRIRRGPWMGVKRYGLDEAQGTNIAPPFPGKHCAAVPRQGPLSGTNRPG